MKKLLAQVLLVCLSGILVALSFPPTGWWPCALFAWGPLLVVASRATPRRAFYLGLLQGMVAYMVPCRWLFRIFGVRTIPLIAIIALSVAFFCLLVNLTVPLIRRPVWKAVFIAVLWTGIEFVRCELFILRFAWITPGLAMGPTWVTPVVGVYGASLLVIAGSALLLRPRTRAAGARAPVRETR